jgi:hypothetical protein
MSSKTFGTLAYGSDKKLWTIGRADAHVWIKLKALFRKIPQEATAWSFSDDPEVCADLYWFTQRYPLQISSQDLQRLKREKNRYDKSVEERERIFTASYQLRPVSLKAGFEVRPYQTKADHFFSLSKRMLLADEYGLGKTLTSLLPMISGGALPAVVVVEPHVTGQWKKDNIEKYTDLTAHIINGHKPYSLPPADVYIIRYTCLASWINVLMELQPRYLVFDECQQLRRAESQKYRAAEKLAEQARWCMGLSATPIFNYGEEIFNIMQIIKPGALGSKNEFAREWCGGWGRVVKDPQALGTYLREAGVFLRRTRREVDMELPEINKLVYTVGYDERTVEASQTLATQLAQKVLNGTFEERGQAARELDMRMRQITGVSKAKEVAAFVRLLLESGETVALSGWHRDCYEIWAEELASFDPAWYTGTESVKQKEESVRRFRAGETRLFIMSNRSGAGVDGLQDVCSFVVIGELDWSPKVHDQFIARFDRPGQKNRVTAAFLVSDFGSDPVIIDLLGLKSSQSHGILDPLQAVPDQYTDESRIKKLAEAWLQKQGVAA